MKDQRRSTEPRRAAPVLAAAGIACSIACAAVYPEIATVTQPVPANRVLDPPPPEDLHWIRFLSAHVPAKTRDGRNWDEVFGSLPDPYAKLMVNDQEILRTPSEHDTLTPSWRTAPHGNFRISDKDRMRIEVWDDSPTHDQPIGVRDIGAPTEDMRIAKHIQIDLEGGGDVTVAFEPAHARLGVGLWYELRTDTCFVTRLLAASPAERAGVQPGDEVLEIGGGDVRKLGADDVRSRFNAISTLGTEVVLRHKGGAAARVTLKQGPIYPRYDQFGPID